jgi:glycosyltransferase involved in cell wall biosynthesis
MSSRAGETKSRSGAAARTTRVLRVISRLNVGGPAIQAITLSRFLDDRGYETVLLRGREGPREGSMDSLAAELGVTPVHVPALERRIGVGDLPSFAFLVRQIRDWQPHILHTHMAKAGALGRIAALAAGRGRPPVIVHTFHGHVLSGYFRPRVTATFTRVERALARHTSSLIAVSDEIRADLVRLRVASPERITVVPLGFDLTAFDVPEDERRTRRFRFRQELGIPRRAALVTLVARIEPIKRVDRFLRVAALINHSTAAHFLVVGDGELRGDLERSPEAQTLGDRITWAGIRQDMPDVYFASDVVVVTSDNEGTAVSAIEAQAARLPVVSTRVGGMPSVVCERETGFLVDPEDDRGLAAAVDALLTDKALSQRLGEEAAARTRKTYSLDRLLADIDALYRRLLSGVDEARQGG